MIEPFMPGMKTTGRPRTTELRAVVDALLYIAWTGCQWRALPCPTWLDNLVAGFLEAPQVHLLSGDTRSYDRCWFGRYHDLNGTLNGRRIRNTDALLYGPTCNLAGYAAVFSELNFDEEFPGAAAEDIEFCFRASLRGYIVGHCLGAVVEHNFGYAGQSFQHALHRFWTQFRRYADGEPLLLDRHANYLSFFGRPEEIPAQAAPDLIRTRNRVCS